MGPPLDNSILRVLSIIVSKFKSINKDEGQFYGRHLLLINRFLGAQQNQLQHFPPFRPQFQHLNEFLVPKAV